MSTRAIIECPNLTDSSSHTVIPILCLLVTIGRFAMDAYLPCLPAIAHDFNASSSQIQLTLTLYLIGFSLSQLFFGPASDHYGRKPVLLWGMGIFIIGSAGCLFASSLLTLNIARFIAGLGIGSSTVLHRAIARDLFSGVKLVKVISNLTLVITITFVVAPSIGAFLQAHWGWRSIFLVTTAYGLSVSTVLYYFLPETLSEKSPTQTSPLKNYKRLIKDTVYLRYVLCASISFSGLIAYFQLSPFLFENQLGLSAMHFGLFSIVIAVGYCIAGLFVKYMADHIDENQLIQIGSAAMLSGGIAQLLLLHYCSLSIITLLIPALIYIIGMRIVMPTGIAFALNKYKEGAGSAAALLGCILMLISSALSFLLSHIGQPSALTLGIVYMTLAMLSFISLKGRAVVLD